MFAFAACPTLLRERTSREAPGRAGGAPTPASCGARSALADVRRPRPPPAGRCRSRAAPAAPGAPYPGERPQGPGSERARRRVRVRKSPPHPRAFPARRAAGLPAAGEAAARAGRARGGGREEASLVGGRGGGDGASPRKSNGPDMN